jgi:hypothetical protein
MCSEWKGWEVWRFVRDEQNPGVFTITSWTHSNKVLCSDPDGKVFTTENKEGDWEKWRITKHPERKAIMMQSVSHGRFLVASGKELHTDQNVAADWHLEPAHSNNFFISATCHDRRVSCSPDGGPFTEKNWKKWEEWVIQPAGKKLGIFRIKSRHHNTFLGSGLDGGVVMTEHYSGEREEWKLVLGNDDGMFIESVHNQGRLLACGENGALYMSEDHGGWETWRLHPIMPSTISGKQIGSLVGVGVGTLVLAIAAPFAVMGVVGALGFQAGGIVAGSAAAGMMSAEAIAAGGGVAAGGTVATLQSIGAVGLGIAGTTTAVSAGAATGLFIGSSALVATGAMHKDAFSSTNVDQPEYLFPLCSWRQW